MNNDNIRKIKLLKLWELLRLQTDEDHPMQTKKVLAKLTDSGISCDRRTLTRDIKTLCDFGYEVMTTYVSHQKAYYIVDRNFDIAELKILIDSVQAASFITDKKTKQLSEKIAGLGGEHSAEVLKGNMIKFNSCKHNNESIYYNVDCINDAITKGRQMSFYYFNLDENCKREYRKNKSRYIAEPIVLIYREDNYYIICYSPEHNKIVNYRVDRMEAVTVEELAVSENAKINEEELAEYSRQSFRMYGGETRMVTLEFKRDLLNAVYDKFGENIKVKKAHEGICKITVPIQISPTFWGWIFQFAGDMVISSPKDLTENYKERAELIIKGELS